MRFHSFTSIRPQKNTTTVALAVHVGCSDGSARRNSTTTEEVIGLERGASKNERGVGGYMLKVMGTWTAYPTVCFVGDSSG